MITNNKYVYDIYKKLHQIPEKSLEEVKTTKFIEKELKKLEYEVIRPNNLTGVIGVLDSGKPGLNLGLRSDIDALGFNSEKGQEFIHACGHDAHSSINLAVAEHYSNKKLSSGKLFFIFQPAEEIGAGAKELIKTKLLDEIDEIIGIHLRPIQEVQLGEATPALIHGASKLVKIRIKGISSHGARPHLGVNAIETANTIINAINTIKVDPRVSHSIKITGIESINKTYNSIPDNVDLYYDLRAQKNEVMDNIFNQIKNHAEKICESYNAKFEVYVLSELPAAEYSDELVKTVEVSIKNILGKSLEPIYTPGGEDFHNYKKYLGIKNTYIGLGADLEPGLHYKNMKFNKKALKYGKNILIDIVKNKYKWEE